MTQERPRGVIEILQDELIAARAEIARLRAGGEMTDDPLEEDLLYEDIMLLNAEIASLRDQLDEVSKFVNTKDVRIIQLEQELINVQRYGQAEIAILRDQLGEALVRENNLIAERDSLRLVPPKVPKGWAFEIRSYEDGYYLCELWRFKDTPLAETGGPVIRIIDKDFDAAIEKAEALANEQEGK